MWHSAHHHRSALRKPAGANAVGISFAPAALLPTATVASLPRLGLRQYHHHDCTVSQARYSGDDRRQYRLLAPSVLAYDPSTRIFLESRGTRGHNAVVRIELAHFVRKLASIMSATSLNYRIRFKNVSLSVSFSTPNKYFYSGPSPGPRRHIR